jgi:hypothetical protein
MLSIPIGILGDVAMLNIRVKKKLVLARVMLVYIGASKPSSLEEMRGNAAGWMGQMTLLAIRAHALHLTNTPGLDG